MTEQQKITLGKKIKVSKNSMIYDEIKKTIEAGMKSTAIHKESLLAEYLELLLKGQLTITE